MPTWISTRPGAFVEYRNANPAVGESAEGTGTAIHGNPHIHYRVIYDRGSIVTDLNIPSLPNLASSLGCRP